MKRPTLHYLTLVMLSAVCLAVAVLVHDLRRQRDSLREVASQLITEQIAQRVAINNLAFLQEETNYDIDWLSDTLGDYFTHCDLDWFIERNTD